MVDALRHQTLETEAQPFSQLTPVKKKAPYKSGTSVHHCAPCAQIEALLDVGNMFCGECVCSDNEIGPRCDAEHEQMPRCNLLRDMVEELLDKKKRDGRFSGSLSTAIVRGVLPRAKVAQSAASPCVQSSHPARTVKSMRRNIRNTFHAPRPLQTNTQL